MTERVRFAAIPRVPLCAAPTPLDRALRLEAALGPDAPRLYLKRDDLTGFGFGGNKARKLEYLLADAEAKGATVLVTEGAVQSNHARITAAAAAYQGLRAVLVVDARNGQEMGGNLLLDHLFGAEVAIVPGPDDRAPEIDRQVAELTNEGEMPYVIPTGGSNPVGSAGYVRASLEIAAQLLDLGEAPSRLYSAAGSCGTMAGLLVGAAVFGASYQVHGVAVSNPASGIADHCLELTNQTAVYIGADCRFTAPDVRINGEFVGEAYGKATVAGRNAIRLLARTEGVLLDPVYTAKAMAALLSDIRNGAVTAGESVVFLHTGGSPAIFAHGVGLFD